jgi:hypothetical protein
LRESDYVQRELEEPVKKIVEDKLRDPFIATKKGEKEAEGAQKGGRAVSQTKDVLCNFLHSGGEIDDIRDMVIDITDRRKVRRTSPS